MKKAVCFLTLIMLSLSLFAGCGSAGKSPAVTSLEQIAGPGAKIGTPVDSMQWDKLHKDYPEANIVAYTDHPLAYADVARGRLDAYVYARREMELAIAHGTAGVRLLEEDYDRNTIAVGLSPVSPIPDLQKKINAFIAELREDGTLDDMYTRWVIRADDTMPEIRLPEHPKLHLRVGTTGTVMPYSYYVGTELCGYDIELAYRFASWLGADLEFKVYDFGGIISATASRDVDCAMSNIFVTPEKEESIPFSDPLFDVGVAVMVRSTDAPLLSAPSEIRWQDYNGSGPSSGTGSAGSSFLAGVKESFEKTFLRENRWKLFLSGIGTTLLITVLSIVFGTILGFCVFMLCRNGNPVANAITRFCVWLVQGMPVVVLLMILYYIIFGRVSISGTAVSVIGFTLVFGSAVYAMVKAGVSTVDRGQTEAAYTLGFTDRRAFFRVVLPQALPHITPAYKAQITALIKATAVVGYVAVQDLTKMADIVRSRTYDAFFPLIAVAVIYFILAAILTFLVTGIEVRIDPRQRSREKILKGVKTGD